MGFFFIFYVGVIILCSNSSSSPLPSLLAPAMGLVLLIKKKIVDGSVISIIFFLPTFVPSGLWEVGEKRVA